MAEQESREMPSRAVKAPDRAGILRCVLFVWCLALPLCAPAEGEALSLEVTPSIGYRLGGEFEDETTGETVDLDEAPSYGLILSLNLDEHSQLELFWSHQETSLEDDGLFSGAAILDLDVDYLHFGGTYIVDGELVRPFVVASMGVTHMNPEQGGFDSETRFSAALGGGIRLFFTRHIGLRFEGRGFVTFIDSDSAVFCRDFTCVIHVKGSVLWQFGAQAGLIVAF
jgi:hypothetical protein